MAQTPLKSTVEARRRAEWSANEHAFLEVLSKRLYKEIEERWLPTEGYSMPMMVTQEEVTSCGPITPGVDSYVRVIEWACAKLMTDPVFKDFFFCLDSSGQDSDGCWGEPVKICISGA